MKRLFSLLMFLAISCMLTRGAFAQLPIQWGDAVVTCEGFNASDPVFGIMRIQNANTAPLNINWAPPMVHPTNWTLGNFGEVFGIAIDPSGDIYLTSTSCYNLHTYTASGPGTIFKVSGTTGLVIWSTPLLNDAATHPALGNVCYDPDHRQLFVTNMEDGRIYRINATTGATINTFDPFLPDGGSLGFAPRGERLWGIAYRKTSADNGIVYFSRWQEDMTHQSSVVSNEIHSINLDPAGNFTGGTTLRITIPPLPGTIYSNPVSDIEFSSAGLMLLGERTMYADDQPTAHQSRMLEYKLSVGIWIPSGHTFDVGALTNFGIKANAAGGVDYGYRGFDSKKGQTLNCDSMAWGTGDALHFVQPPPPPADYNYGMQGFPATGGSIANSVLIDFDGDTTNQAKTQLGDVDVYKNCSIDVNPCLQRRFQIVSDPQAPAGACCWILTLTNNFSATFWTQIQLNIISGGTFSGASAQPGWTVGLAPASVHFTPPGAGFMPIGNSVFRYCLAATAVPQRVQVVWIGADGTRCYDTLFTDCPPPPKLCAQLTGVKIACGQVVNGQQQYTMGFQIFNSTSLPFTISSASIIVTSPPGVSFAPGFLAFPTVNPGGTSIPLNGAILGGHAGDKVCLAITVCNQRRDTCCRFDTCFVLPKCVDCCDSLHIRLGSVKQSVGGSGTITLSEQVTSNPTLLRSFNATIVSATQSIYCPRQVWGGVNPVAAIFTSGSFTTAPPLPVSPWGTGTVTWGTNPSGVTVVNAPLSLTIKFPPAPGFRCRDTIRYCIKYTYTDVNCHTCDTTVCYLVVRYGLIFFPGDVLTPDKFPFGPGKDNGDGKASDGRTILSDGSDAKPIRITMASESDGTLTVENTAPGPDDDPASAITIVGIGIEPAVGIDLTSFSDNSTGQAAEIVDRVAMISDLSNVIASGQSRDFRLVYNNPLGATSFQNVVRIRYRVADATDDIQEATIAVYARTPAGAGGDVLAVDNGIALTNVRTYGLMFDNGNHTGDKIARVVVTLGRGDDDAIMAVGPGIDKTSAGLKAYATVGSDISIPLLLSEEPSEEKAVAAPLGSKAHVSPIYVTVCGGTDRSVTLNYTSYNDAGEAVSTGTITADVPLSARSSGISDQVVTGVGSINCVPNPLTNQAMIIFVLPRAENQVWVTVTDPLGREVAQLLNGVAQSDGTHSMSFDASKLASGTYFYTIRTSAFTQTRSMQIVH